MDLERYESRLDDEAQDNPNYGSIDLPDYTDDELLDMAIFYAPSNEVQYA